MGLLYLTTEKLQEEWIEMAKTKVKTSASAELGGEYVNSSAMPP